MYSLCIVFASNYTFHNAQKNQKDGEKQIRKTANSGRVVYGDDGIEGTKGRMSRSYTIQSHDIGKMKTIYGSTYKIYTRIGIKSCIEYAAEMT